ncbi:hypothetical protein POJ06DRAFT_120360 [Lipomyces tetrasporus]|uniref:F-box domain-containing protein n=1 Tax=Lipomyces tetrasporus TaxID=54092 RepID=A0AAD7QRA1_9ASCO|nr:uncharacterized protein POJ06DRAFT_120360 [Lipomyces tetrasporus]KAJ8099950.1 hypothetical protein POJ06DRAFT_120360 [Lipomyces tetrasporus]
MPPKSSKPSSSSRKPIPKKRRLARRFGYVNLTASGDDEDDLDYREYDGEAGDYIDDSDIPLKASVASTRHVKKRDTRNRRGNNLSKGMDERAAQSAIEPNIDAPCYLSSLPVELIRKILDYVEPNHDLTKYEKKLLGTYCTVNRVFKDILQPRLFNTIRITQLKALYQFSSILEKSPIIGAYPRDIQLELQCSLEEESNMVAAALTNTLPRCTTLHSVEVLFKAPMGFQVIFPLLGRNFYAPSVERLDIRLGVFTTSFMQFVGGFSKLKVLHLEGINFDKLLISDKDKKLSLSSIETLMLSKCFVGQTTIELLSNVLPQVKTISLFVVKGLTSDFLIAMRARCSSFSTLNVYRCGDAKGKLTSRISFHLPLSLWTSLTSIRIQFCGDLRPESFPTFEHSGVTNLENLKFVEIFEMYKNWNDEHLPEIARTLDRFVDLLNRPSGEEKRRNFEVSVIFRKSLEPYAKYINEAFDDNQSYWKKVKGVGDDVNVSMVRTVQDEIGKGSWAIGRQTQQFSVIE